MLHSADLVFDNNRLVFLNDESTRRHKDTGLKLFIFLAACLEGEMGDCNLISPMVPCTLENVGTNKNSRTGSTLPLDFRPVSLLMLE